MRASLIFAAIGAFSLSACTSTGGRNLGTTPPTGYVAMTEQSPFGVIHESYPGGDARVSVRLNRTGTPERARNLALYQAARLAEHRNADSITIVREKGGMDCHYTDEPMSGGIGGGDSIVVVPALIFTAIFMSTVKARRYTAFPTHEMRVSFARHGAAAPGAASISVDEILAAWTPVFEPDRASGEAAGYSSEGGEKKKEKSGRASSAERNARIRNAHRNADMCKSRFAAQRKLDKQRKREERAQRKADVRATDQPGEQQGGKD